jgi:hypothetical protein
MGISGDITLEGMKIAERIRRNDDAVEVGARRVQETGRIADIDIHQGMTGTDSLLWAAGYL